MVVQRSINLSITRAMFTIIRPVLPYVVSAGNSSSDEGLQSVTRYGISFSSASPSPGANEVQSWLVGNADVRPGTAC